MTARCSDCKRTWKNEDTIDCFRCGESFHTKCLNETKEFNDEIMSLLKNDNNTIRWFCISCDKNSKEVYDELRELKKKMMETHQEQLEILMRLEAKCDSVDNSKAQSYASVVKKPKNYPVILIKPKKDQKVKETKEFLRRNIDPIVVPVNGFLNAAKGSVLVKCKDESMEKVHNEIVKQMGTDYDVSIPEQKKPRVKILNVYEDSETENDALVFRIAAQNDLPIKDKSDIKIVKVEKRNNRENRKNVIIEVTPLIYEKMMSLKFLNIHWSRYPVVESIHIVRCYKCGEFGHMSNRNCENKQSCPKCSQEHKIGDCKSRHEKCSNCTKYNHQLNLNLNTNHAVWDRKCPVYLRKIKMKKRCINYSTEPADN